MPISDYKQECFDRLKDFQNKDEPLTESSFIKLSDGRLRTLMNGANKPSRSARPIKIGSTLGQVAQQTYKEKLIEFICGHVPAYQGFMAMQCSVELLEALASYKELIKKQ